MVEIKIGDKTIKLKSYSNKSHLKTNDLIPLEKLEIDTSSKLTKWFFNGEYKSGTHYLQTVCLQCGKNLFSITTTRLAKEIRTQAGEVSFICRSCSCKNNAKKIDMKKRAKKRKENWNKKTEEEKKAFAEAVSKGRLKHANITNAKIKNAIHAYTIEKKPLSDIRDILDVAGKHTASKILKKQGVSLRNFSEARSIYMQANPELNPAKRLEVRKKISKRLKENPKSMSGKPSIKEKEFYAKLIGNKSSHPTLSNKRYDAMLDGVYIEFDGTYWHGKDENNYSIIQIKSLLNDEEKNQLIMKNNASLYRVWSDEKFEKYTLDEIKDKAYFIIEDGMIKRDKRKFSNLIMTSEYAKYIVEKYPNDVEENLYRIALFVQTFYPFPYIKNEEKLKDVVSKIKKNKNSELSSSFRIGNNFLKSRFKSFFHASKSRKKSIYDAYWDLDILAEIIGNRLGITYKEHWDLTPDTIRRGFISNYYSVSFFNPVLAYKIFNRIAKTSDTILDMSAGFGGRMLGWYAFQDNGKYIAYEPNMKTYKELKAFSKELNSNIEIYNLPFENVGDHEADIAFSCPPYFNTEIYSSEETQSSSRYETFDEWIRWLKDCINKMKERADKVYLVVDKRIKNNLDCKVEDVIKNKGSHFTNKENYEYLIKLK